MSQLNGKHLKFYMDGSFKLLSCSAILGDGGNFPQSKIGVLLRLSYKKVIIRKQC